MNELLAWLHPDCSGQLVRAPAETMLLKSKPYFVRCRDMKIQVTNITYTSVETVACRICAGHPIASKYQKVAIKLHNNTAVQGLV